MHTLLFQHDMNMYLYGRLMDNIERRRNMDIINYFTIKEIRMGPLCQSSKEYLPNMLDLDY
jgi:hypothetical protein